MPPNSAHFRSVNSTDAHFLLLPAINQLHHQHQALSNPMNSRKAARSVPATVSRLLKSNAFLKKPPPAFYPTLSYPPPPSLVRSLPSRSPDDLPRTAGLSAYQAAKRRLDAGERLTKVEERTLAVPQPELRVTRRKPPRAANSRNNRPLPIVFPEDEVRKAFFRDHPFEAYRPVYLAEGESVAEELQPNGKAWTALVQRSRIPTAEECIPSSDPAARRRS